MWRGISPDTKLHRSIIFHSKVIKCNNGNSTFKSIRKYSNNVARHSGQRRPNTPYTILITRVPTLVWGHKRNLTQVTNLRPYTLRSGHQVRKTFGDLILGPTWRLHSFYLGLGLISIDSDTLLDDRQDPTLCGIYQMNNSLLTNEKNLLS